MVTVSSVSELVDILMPALGPAVDLMAVSLLTAPGRLQWCCVDGVDGLYCLPVHGPKHPWFSNTGGTRRYILYYYIVNLFTFFEGHPHAKYKLGRTGI